MDTGDVVKHLPSGEIWVVAYVKGDRLAWCGWPEGEARVDTCELVREARPADRLKLLREMACMTGPDARQRYAAHRLAEEADNVASTA